MIRRSWMTGMSIETTLELWESSLRAVKARMEPWFTQERVAASAGLFLDGLLGDERRKTGWMRAEAAGDPGPWRQQAILGRGWWDAYAQLGIRMAEEEINKAGGVMGRQLEITAEDSVNPATAATKAQRMLEQDGATVLMGEINSASSLTIMQVADRNKKLFIQTGARSDALRGKNCNRYTFHTDIPNTVMVNTVGKALLRDNMVKDKKFFGLTADYIFGHDLLAAAKRFFAANQGNLIGDELIATDVTDFSPYLLKIRQAKPDVVCSNLAGNQVTTLIKQYAEFGLPYPCLLY